MATASRTLTADRHARVLVVGEPGARRGMQARHAHSRSPEEVIAIGQQNARLLVSAAGLRRVRIVVDGQPLLRVYCGESPLLCGRTDDPELPEHVDGWCPVAARATSVHVAWQEGERVREALLALPPAAQGDATIDLAAVAPPAATPAARARACWPIRRPASHCAASCPAPTASR